MALDAAQPRERHLKMLDDADEKEPAKSGESDALRDRLKRMLEEAAISAEKK
jgi:hypothetical protein